MEANQEVKSRAAGTTTRAKRKITRTSVVEQVCDAIKQDIINGVWKEGDKLPSEGEFAAMFGVNRLSVRMALQKLSTLGIIETRVGEGSFVCSFSLKPFLSQIAVMYDSGEKFREVQQLRNLLEGECMNLAILRASDEEKQTLRERLEQYNADALAYTRNMDDPDALDRVVDSDLAFHYQVVKMGHNSLYKDIYFMVQQLIRQHIAHLISTRVHRRAENGLPTTHVSDTHDIIYNGIVNGDPEAVRRAREETLGLIPIHGMDVFD